MIGSTNSYEKYGLFMARLGEFFQNDGEPQFRSYDLLMLV
jgi:hypothetical protein